MIATGTGRCGTGYVARLLTLADVPCTHEQRFTPRGVVRKRGNDSSWLAAPYLDRFPGEPIIKVVRDPFNVLRSLLGIGFFADEPHPGHIPYLRFIETWAPAIGGVTEAGRAISFMVHWDAMIDEKAPGPVGIVQVERPLDGDWPDEVDRSRLEWAVTRVDRNVNSRRRAEIGYGDLDSYVKERIHILRVLWGYE